MSCNHLCDCDRCREQVVALSKALKEAIDILNLDFGDTTTEKIYELIDVLQSEGLEE